MSILRYTWVSFGENFMSPTVQQKVKKLLDKYFIGQSNGELVIKQDKLDNFLSEYNTIIITRTIDVCGLR